MGEVAVIPAKTLTLAAASNLAAVGEACQQARSFLAKAGLGQDELDSWQLVLAEAGNNAAEHATPKGANLPIRFDLSVTSGLVEVRITDHTPGFDFPDIAVRPPPLSEGGRGLFLIQHLTDESVYLRGGGENCLVLRKKRKAAC